MVICRSILGQRRRKLHLHPEVLSHWNDAGHEDQGCCHCCYIQEGTDPFFKKISFHLLLSIVFFF